MWRHGQQSPAQLQTNSLIKPEASEATFIKYSLFAALMIIFQPFFSLKITKQPKLDKNKRRETNKKLKS